MEVELKRVSIIMPCYNDGKYIYQAIDSVREQTYQEIELIIIDDGSEDKETVRIINEIEKDGGAIILHTEHLGPSEARNQGINHASGQYILPLDSDDIIDKTYVQKCVKILDERASTGVVYCLADLFGEKKGIWELPPYSFRNMLVHNVIFVTAMFRKEDWEQVGGFDTSMYAGMEDYAFWLSILALGKEIYQIPEILFHYRVKKVSRTSRFLDEKEQAKETYRKIYFNHKDFYQEHLEEYALALRDALVEEEFMKRKYALRFEKFQKMKRIPFIRWAVKKLWGEKG